VWPHLDKTVQVEIPMNKPEALKNLWQLLTGLIDDKAPGGRRRLDTNQRAALAAAVESGPIPAAHGVVRWRLIDLVQWIRDEFAVSISTQTLSRELRAMGYRKLTARPRHHAQDADAIPAFKKTSPPRWQQSGRRSPAGRP
jgi:transposase